LVKDDAIIDETDTFEGVVTFLQKTENQGRYVRIDWTRPRAQSIALRGDVFESYVPALKTMTIGTATQISAGSSGLFSLLAGSKRQMMENYGIDYLGQEQIIGGVQTWHLRVTPKNRTGYYRFSDIWVDGDGMPLQVMDSGGRYSTRPVSMERLGLTPAVMAMVKRTEEETGVKINCEIDPIFEFVTDTTTVTLTSIRKNETVQGSIFKISVPNGTKVIKQ
jgi:outer membrane lipoprotein-sorting protein